MKIKLVSVVLVIIMLFTGCAKKEAQQDGMLRTSDTAGAASYAIEDYALPAMAALQDTQSIEKNAHESPMPTTGEITRLIARNGTLKISVPDVEFSIGTVQQIAARYGGFVVNSNTRMKYYHNNSELPYGEITIRVRVENFDKAISEIEALVPANSKEVIEKEITGADITSDFVDAQSQLTNLENTRNKLNEILNNAKTTKDTLAVYTEIAAIEKEIEYIKGRMKYMQDSAALSSITVRINSIVPDTGITIGKWSINETFKDAVSLLIEWGQGFLDFIIYFMIAALPFLIIFFLPIILIIRWLLRKNKSRKSPPTQL